MTSEQQLRLEALKLALSASTENAVQRAEDYLRFIEGGRDGEEHQKEGMSMIEALRVAKEKGKWACHDSVGRIRYIATGVILNKYNDFPSLSLDAVESNEWTVVD